MAVCGLDASVHTVNNKFGALVSADLPTGIDGLLFGREMAARSLCAAAFYIPATLGIVNNMMRRTCHNDYPLCALGQQVAQPSASK